MIVQTFQSLIKFDSTCPPPVSALLYLAQLSDEDPHGALSYYRSAVDIFQTQLKGKGKHPSPQGDEEEESQLRKNIAAALVGMVEIWMDPRYDLWSVETSCLGFAATENGSALTRQRRPAARSYLTLHFKLIRGMWRFYKPLLAYGCRSNVPTRPRPILSRHGSVGKISILVRVFFSLRFSPKKHSCALLFRRRSTRTIRGCAHISG
jgi:hypothetical protein